MNTDAPTDRVPLRGLWISLFAFVVAVAGNVWLSPAEGGNELVLWLPALIPAFLLAYYRGWRGVGVALAGGMAAMSLVGALGAGPAMTDVAGVWPIAALGGYIGICLGIGWLSEGLHRRRHAAEEKLGVTTDWLHAVVQGSRDAIFVSDDRLAFVLVNRAATELTGYSRDELLRMGIPDLAGDSDAEAYRKYHDAVMSGRARATETRIRRQDGSCVDVEINGRRIEVGGRAYVHAAVRDVTERRAREARMRHVQRLESLGEVTGGIAHDFNNLLTVIGANTELLAARLESCACETGGPALEEEQQIVNDLRGGVESATTLARKLLAFARQTPLDREPVSLVERIPEHFKILRRLIRSNVRMTLEVQDDAPPVLADEGSIQQMLMNLVLNAQDAISGAGEVRISVEAARMGEEEAAEREDARPGSYVRLTVSDDGTGMDEETRRSIFKPFFTTKKRDRGTGLGLAVVYGLVKDHQGWIDVESRPGEGSTFSLCFPASDRAETRTEGAPEIAEVPRGNGESILLVEDEPTLRATAQRTLERLGYRVLLAGEAEAALELCGECDDQVDLVITDWMMPGMNGAELIRRLHEKRPGLPCILSSGYPPDIEIADPSGDPIPFVQKPWTVTSLAATVRSTLGSGQDTRPPGAGGLTSAWGAPRGGVGARAGLP